MKKTMALTLNGKRFLTLMLAGVMVLTATFNIGLAKVYEATPAHIAILDSSEPNFIEVEPFIKPIIFADMAAAAAHWLGPKAVKIGTNLFSSPVGRMVFSNQGQQTGVWLGTVTNAATGRVFSVVTQFGEMF